MIRMLQFLKKFRRDEQGIAFVEFAMALPFLFVLLLGGIEMTRYILITQKVEKASMIIADVTAQGTSITTTDLNNIVDAAADVLYPYPFTGSGFVVVSSVKQNGAYSVSNPPVVDWQYDSSGMDGSWTQPSQIGTVGRPATLPPGMTLNDKDNVIIAEVFYNYQPILATNGIMNPGMIYRNAIYKPRLGDLSTLGALPFWSIIDRGLL